MNDAAPFGMDTGEADVVVEDEITEETVRRERQLRLTDRDRRVLAVLSMARFLSTEQLQVLFFRGRSESACRNRLALLAGLQGSAKALLRRRHVSLLHGGSITTWSLTEAGYFVAREVVGEASRPPEHAIGAAFIQQTVALNALLVERLRDEHLGCKPLDALPFRWRAADLIRCSWTIYDPRRGGTKQVVLIPDAALELPREGRRVFIDWCVPAERAPIPLRSQRNAFTARLHRYLSFFEAPAEPPNEARTQYQLRFVDGLAPEVHFVVGDVVQQRVYEDALTRAVPMRARGLLPARIVQLAELVPSGPAETAKAIEASSLLVKASDIEQLRAFYSAAITAIRDARHAIRAAGVPIREPPYPPNTSQVHAWLTSVSGS